MSNNEKPKSTEPSNVDNGTAEEFNYKLLVGHQRTDGSYKSDEQLRMEYISLTDELIEKIQSGIQRTNPETGEIERHPIDNVIFLDKSARPVAWLMKAIWEKLATDTDGNTSEMPEINFLNIDRKQWIDAMDPNKTGSYSIDSLNPEVVRSLRSIFVSNESLDALGDNVNSPADIPESIRDMPSKLDGKNILVVDEVRSTGRTLDMSVKLLSAAFPDANVEGTFWMSGQVTKLAPRSGGISVGNADLPVWYSDSTKLGRGIGDRQRESTTAPITKRQRLGAWFLSSRLPEVDPLSNRLREELHQLASKPDVPIRPSLYRDDFDERVARLNNTTANQAIKSIRSILDK